jgi:hypothetical protein
LYEHVRAAYRGEKFPWNPKFRTPVVYTTDGPWADLWPYWKCKSYPAAGGVKPGVGIIWGLLRGTLELLDASIRREQPWIYLDHGYFHRGHYFGHYRLSWCDFQQRNIIERPADRWEQLGVKLEPWRKGRNIVVCPPSDVVLRLLGEPNWIENVVKELQTKTDRPVIIQTKGQPFDEALKDAHCVVTIASIAAVEAVSKGVPAFVWENAAAAPVSRTDLEVESPIYPDREPWCWSLAYGQFTKEEWASGLAWDVMSENLDD